jgi:signal transduction histidine kinase
VISTGATAIKVKMDFGNLTDDFLIETTEQINTNAQYLSKTIDDFKNFIKGDSQAKSFKLENNLQSFMKLTHPVAKAHEIDVIIDIDNSLELFGYPNELLQCLINLFNNSKDALDNVEYEEKYFFIDSAKDEDKVSIIIKDNAGGIPENIKGKIFEPYFTTKHKSQGTGIGLTMLYNIIVNGMDGSIEVENIDYSYNERDYKGASFTITIPLKFSKSTGEKNE